MVTDDCWPAGLVEAFSHVPIGLRFTPPAMPAALSAPTKCALMCNNGTACRVIAGPGRAVAEAGADLSEAYHACISRLFWPHAPDFAPASDAGFKASMVGLRMLPGG